MANLTNYAEKKMLDKTLGIADYAAPTPHLALLTASPGETGSLAAEVSGSGYARVDLASKMTATVLGTGLCTNSAALAFAASGGDWGAITHVAVCDAASGGNVLLYAPLFSAQLVLDGGLLEFVPDAFSIFAVISNPNGLTQYTAKKWLDHLFNIASFTMPTSIHLAALSADPTSAGLLTNEIATGGYGRQALTGLMDETELETGISINNTGLVFPVPTANYNITHYGVMDAPASGNMLLRKARGSTLNVFEGGSPVQVDAGHLALRAA